MEGYRSQKTALSEKEKAVFERRIWVLVKYLQLHKRRSQRRDWFFETFGGTKMEYSDRQSLLGKGDWADPLWDRIHHDRMPVRTANRLAVKVEKRVSNSTTPVEYNIALKEELREYDSAGYLTYKGGKKFRRRNPKTKAKRRCKKSRKGADDVSDELSFDVSTSKKLKAAVGLLIEHYLQQQLVGVSESIQKEFLSEFLYGLHALFDDLFRDVVKERIRRKKEVEFRDISWRRFQNACATLNITASASNPPDYGVVHKRFRDMAKRFHPDKNAGDERYVLQYQAVVDAWDVIKDYYRRGNNGQD